MQAAADRAVEKAEARATRRRWITLAEFVAVAGLVIAALGLWLTWSDRRSDQAEKAATQASEAHARSQVRLTGDIDSDGETIRLSDPQHQIDSVTVAFPTALGIAPQSSVLGPRIAVDWFAAPLKAMDQDAGRLPVLLTSTYWDGDTKRTDTAIYDIAWRRGSKSLGILGGRKIAAVRLSLHAHGGSQAALDALWKRTQAAR